MTPGDQGVARNPVVTAPGPSVVMGMEMGVKFWEQSTEVTYHFQLT